MKMSSNIDLLNRAWGVITEVLTPGKSYVDSGPSYPGPEIEFQQSIEILRQQGLSYIIEEWFIDEIKQDLTQNVSKKFWSYFKDIDTTDATDDDYSQLVAAVDYLHSVLSQYTPCIQRLEWLKAVSDSDSDRPPTNAYRHKNLSDFMITLYKAILLSSVCKQFLHVVEIFYSKAFRVFQHTNTVEEQGVSEKSTAFNQGNIKRDNETVLNLLQDNFLFFHVGLGLVPTKDEDEEESTLCNGCSEETENCSCQQIMEHFNSVNRKLDEIGLLERISGGAVTSIVHSKIVLHIEETCKGSFENSFMDCLEEWLDTKVLEWLNLIYSGNRSNIGPDCISAFKGRLLHFTSVTYARLLIDQLFNIIIEFPESEPAILDLKLCLEKTDLRSHLVSSLKTALETRLLHPGVNTADILTAYISAIRALRVLDPAGVILELVCDPVRKYLRSRDDTVRCIVSSLTDDGSNELLEELVKGQPLMLDEGEQSDDENEDWLNWMPDPVDADPSCTSRSRRASDIISMLVNIYGSKELFVNEYRTLLADRILTQFNYDIVKELRYLELLKLRFGETQLHYCEVMLKDVGDSKRINANIVEEKAKLGEVDDIDVKAMILSAQFWPSFREEKITLPENMQEALEKYTKKFSMLKGNRTLNWKSHLGLVTLEIEVKDRLMTFNVSPVHAAIIMQFQNQSRWTVEELSGVLQMPATALRRKITYWQSQGLLKEEETDTFLLVEEHKGTTQDMVLPDEEEAESAMASAQVQREEELQVFWSFIVGMLTNLDSLPIERIHSMLRMFAMQGPSTVECSIQELKLFLDRKVKEQKLLYSGGVYRLPKI